MKPGQVRHLRSVSGKANLAAEVSEAIEALRELYINLTDPKLGDRPLHVCQAVDLIGVAYDLLIEADEELRS